MGKNKLNEKQFLLMLSGDPKWLKIIPSEKVNYCEKERNKLTNKIYKLLTFTKFFSLIAWLKNRENIIIETK